MAIISGNNSNNTLNGTPQADTIDGMGGNDTIAGGAGNDLLSGGAGDDIFVLATGDGFDTILGGEGVDRIVAAAGTMISLRSGFGPASSIEEIVARQIFPQKGTPDDVWNFVSLLLSPSASMVSGETLHVGGV